jgi:hypothetical protein
VDSVADDAAVGDIGGYGYMKAAKADSNQKEIVQYFRKMGVDVFHTHTVGGGFPDVVLGYKGVNMLVEIKDGSKPPSARALTKQERKFHAEWGGDVQIVETLDDCLELISKMRAEK